MNPEQIKAAFRNLLTNLYPELGQRTHLNHKARVIAVNSTAGTPAVQGGPRFYSVDLQPLHPDGTNDPERPVLKDVALDVPWGGVGRGLLALPAVGSIVRVGFYGGSAAHPYIDGILADGHVVPQVQQGELVVKFAAGEVRIKESNGEVSITTTGDVVFNAEVVRAEAGYVQLDAPDVDLGGPGGERLARLGDFVYSIVNPLTPIGTIGTRLQNPANGTERVRGI